jgi:hypothetical protein
MRNARTAARLAAVLVVLVPATRAWAASPWTVQTSPSPGHGPALHGVTTLSPTSAWAVGSYTDSAHDDLTLIEHYDGTAWAQQTSYSVADADNDLWAVKGVTDSIAIAVGDSIDSNFVKRTLVERYNGTKWVHQSSPSPDPDDNSLRSVAAPTGANAWAVGEKGLNSTTLIEHYDGSAWTVQTSPHPGSASSLTGVSTDSASSVWAAGSWYSAGGDGHTLIEHYNGTKWVLQATPDLPDEGSFSSISAVSAADVWAVGYQISQGFPRTLIEHYDGTSWTVVPSPNAGSNQNYLYGVKATSSTNAWAVGSYSTDSGNERTLVLHYDGANWTIQSSPNIGTFDELYAVGATSSTNAFAVGLHGSKTMIMHCC